MPTRTLHTQALLCAAVFFALAHEARAASFQITGVTPAAAYSCPSAQGCTTTVIVQGQGFNHLTGCVILCLGPEVLFGGVAGTITNITDTEISVILPVHSPGTVDVTVVGLFGQESSNLPAGFTFLDPAAIPLLDARTAVLLALALALIGWVMSARHW